MGAPIGAIVSGINYQVGLFWTHALPMIAEENYIDTVEMEKREADGMDDIFVFYAEPGKNENGKLTKADFFQAKYHVDGSNTLDSGYFTSSPKGVTPLIQRFAKTWQSQKTKYSHIRLIFVTTWQWNSKENFGRHVTSDGALDKSFIKNESGKKIHKKWQQASGLNSTEFKLFLEDFYIYAPYPLFQLSSQLRIQMNHAQLVLPKQGEERNALTELGNKFLATGRIVWTKDKLTEVLKQENLFAPKPAQKNPIVSIRSFARMSGLGIELGSTGVDLTDLFDGRFPISRDAWSTDIPKRLFDSLVEIERLDKTLEIALDCHLSIAWHFGMLLDPKTGIKTLIRQKNNQGTEIWDPVITDNPENEWMIEQEVEGNEDLVIIASLTHESKLDVLRSLPNLGLEKAHIIHYRYKNVGMQSVKDGKHALSLAQTLVDNIKTAISKSETKRVHLFFSAPVSFAFLLGQYSGVISPATVYEYDFKGTKTYSPGMSSTTN